MLLRRLAAIAGLAALVSAPHPARAEATALRLANQFGIGYMTAFYTKRLGWGAEKGATHCPSRFMNCR